MGAEVTVGWLWLPGDGRKEPADQRFSPAVSAHKHGYALGKARLLCARIWQRACVAQVCLRPSTCNAAAAAHCESAGELFAVEPPRVDPRRSADAGSSRAPQGHEHAAIGQEGSELWLFNSVPMREREAKLQDKGNRAPLRLKNLRIRHAVWASRGERMGPAVPISLPCCVRMEAQARFCLRMAQHLRPSMRGFSALVFDLQLI